MACPCDVVRTGIWSACLLMEKKHILQLYFRSKPVAVDISIRHNASTATMNEAECNIHKGFSLDPLFEQTKENMPCVRDYYLLKEMFG